MNNEYPTKKQLKTIRTWLPNDFHGLMAYIKPLWNYSDCGYWTQIGEEYQISTGGWSGNEEIIGAMQQNLIWWVFYWYQSRRGGHYVFKGTR